MKIAIIGGGWVGCHLAMKLKDTHDVVVYEENRRLFEESSLKNQNRLHLGYHYTRNYRTRLLCKNTFERFINDYNFLVIDITNNLYCIPNESLLDFETIKKIYSDYNYEIFVNQVFNNIQGCIRVDEKYIDFNKAYRYFNKHLNNIVKNGKVSTDDMVRLSNSYDLVINCTNNFIKDLSCPTSYYELACTFLYENKRPISFSAATFIDGDFFSIYPYSDKLYSVTDVKHTPLKEFSTVEELNSFQPLLSDIDEKREAIENKILRYYPDFNNDFAYKDYFLSVKSKYINSSADRYPVINTKGNVVNTFTGKIQGIYIIEDYINEIISR